MDAITEAFLRRPAPLLDPALVVDRFTAVKAGTVTMASGAGHAVRVTRPLPHVVRLRIGAGLPAESGLLMPGADVDLDLGLDLGLGLGHRPSVELAADGLRFGAFAPPPSIGTLLGPSPGWGRVTRSDATPAQRAAGATDGWLASAAIGAGEEIYGGGESFQGPNLRGRYRRLVNAETHGAGGLDLAYLNVPFFWSTAGWGLLAHTGAPVQADLGHSHPNALALVIPGDTLDLFVIDGDPAICLAAYHELTGFPGEVPDWTFGVWTSRCSYLSATEVSGIVAGYDEADCPLDVVHVDAWQTGNVVADLVCNWEPDTDRFPSGWAGALTDRDIRLSLWHNSFLLPGQVAGADAQERGLLLRNSDGELVGTNDMPERMVLDWSAPGAEAWWRDRLRGVLTSEGAASMKADFAEEVPPTAVCADGRTGWQVRNEYSATYQRATHTVLADTLGTSAPMFCRSGTTGAQRYPCHWVGDTPSTWSGMESALRGCLSLSLTGFGLVASDVGGFHATGAYERTIGAMASLDGDLFTADVDPELFLRWTQWGALSPVLRFHGAGRREPWAYPDPFGALAVQACRVRATLRDYLVSAARTAATEGTPMMRPMPLAYPGDRAARAADLQYLLGPDLLVAPVLRAGGGVEVFAPSAGWRPLVAGPTLSTAGWHFLTLEPHELPAWIRPGALNPWEGTP